MSGRVIILASVAFALWTCAESGEPQPLIVKSIRGTVRFSSGGDWQPLLVGRAIVPGIRIRALTDSSAVFLSGDGCFAAKLGDESVMSIESPNAERGQQLPCLHIESGSMYCVAKKAAGQIIEVGAANYRCGANPSEQGIVEWAVSPGGHLALGSNSVSCVIATVELTEGIRAPLLLKAGEEYDTATRTKTNLPPSVMKLTWAEFRALQSLLTCEKHTNNQ